MDAVRSVVNAASVLMTCVIVSVFVPPELLVQNSTYTGHDLVHRPQFPLFHRDVPVAVIETPLELPKDAQAEESWGWTWKSNKVTEDPNTGVVIEETILEKEETKSIFSGFFGSEETVPEKLPEKVDEGYYTESYYGETKPVEVTVEEPVYYYPPETTEERTRTTHEHTYTTPPSIPKDFVGRTLYTANLIYSDPKLAWFRMSIDVVSLLICVILWYICRSPKKPAEVQVAELQAELIETHQKNQQHAQETLNGISEKMQQFKEAITDTEREQLELQKTVAHQQEVISRLGGQPDVQRPGPRDTIKNDNLNLPQLTPTQTNGPTQNADQEAKMKAKLAELQQQEKQEQERIRAEANRNKEAEEKKKRDEAEKKRVEDELKKKALEDEQKKLEAERKKKEEETKRKAEEDAKRVEDEKKRKELEAKKIEDAKKAEEAKKKAEEDAKRADEAKKKTEEDAKRAEEAKKKAEEDLKRTEEAKKKAEEDAKRADEAKKKMEEDAKRAEEAKKKAEEEKKQKELALKKAEEDRVKAEEAKRKQEEAAKPTESQPTQPTTTTPTTPITPAPTTAPTTPTTPVAPTENGNTAIAPAPVKEVKLGQKAMYKGQTGSVRFVGPTQFAPGEWVGLEFDIPIGKNDGTFGGVNYFGPIKQNHGLFVKKDNVQLVD